MAALCALQHECAHAFAARRFGYSLDTVTLMPYGAVVSGELSGMEKKEELWVLLAGPLANAVTALGFVALWWLFPEAYPYTEAAAYLSLSLFVVNLLPAYPLDGGRMLFLALSRFGKKRARILVTVLSCLTAAGVAAFFVWSCFSSPQWTALFFAAALVVGAVESLFGGGRYRPVTFSRERELNHGVPERRVVISADCPLSRALRYLTHESYLVLVLYDNGEFFGELTEEEYLEALKGGDYSRSLKEFLPIF